VRANTCVACHQNLDPDVRAAGHPELRFELDSQSVAEPKHWRDEDVWTGPRSWLTGQAVALREMSWALTQRTADDRDRAQWNALAWIVAKAVGVETGTAKTTAPVFAPSPSDFAEMQRTADELARQAPSWPLDDGLILRLLRELAATDAEFAVRPETPVPLLAHRAERLVLGLNRLAAAVEANGGTKLNVDNELRTLSEDARHVEQFDPAQFASHLQTLSLALAQGTR